MFLKLALVLILTVPAKRKAARLRGGSSRPLRRTRSASATEQVTIHGVSWQELRGSGVCQNGRDGGWPGIGLRQARPSGRRDRGVGQAAEVLCGARAI